MNKHLIVLVVTLLLGTTVRAQAPIIGVAWEQLGASPAVAQTFIYRAYFDGQAGVILQGVVCTQSGTVAECRAPLPTPSNGEHTLFLTGANAAGEGERSGTIRFTYPPPDTPPAPTIGTPIAPQNLWIIRIGS